MSPGRPPKYAGVTDDCLKVNVSDVIAPKASDIERRRGTIRWTRSDTGAEIAAISFEFDREPDHHCKLLLRYVVIDNGCSHPITLAAPLTVTRPYFGGHRYWFRCPHETEGGICGARVCTLYLPPGAILFGCRGCHNLTYATSRPLFGWIKLGRSCTVFESAKSALARYGAFRGVITSPIPRDS
jgi:hypothetical protein